MTPRRHTVALTAPDFTAIRRDLDFDALRRDLNVPDGYPAAALAEATAAADRSHEAADRSDIPFVTVDPTGARDLDQAVHIAARNGGGYLVSYAIADVAAFVRPGGPLDAEVARRGETLYFPDRRVALHPPVLSEGTASLLPGQLRPAALWQMALDADGAVVSATVTRAVVRSVEQLDYPGLQRRLDTGDAPPAVALLGDVGTRRLALARARHAITLDLPEQEVERDPAGRWHLELREQLEVEAWNAEISLLTGMCAADIMRRGGVGLLRTLPPPDARTIENLRRIARSLDVDWPRGARPSDVLAGLDRRRTRHVAFIEHAASLLRGAAYIAFDTAAPAGTAQASTAQASTAQAGTGPGTTAPAGAAPAGAAPADAGHAGVGAGYAHVTAPLRRLVDRYGTEVCLALQAGRPVPEWVRAALPGLPEIMRGADQRAHAAERAVLDAVEAWLLRDQVGRAFDAVVLSAGPESAKIAIDEPAVRATCTGAGLVDGSRITVRLVAADVATRTVRFAAAGASIGPADPPTVPTQ